MTNCAATRAFPGQSAKGAYARSRPYRADSSRRPSSRLVSAPGRCRRRLNATTGREFAPARCLLHGSGVHDNGARSRVGLKSTLLSAVCGCERARDSAPPGDRPKVHGSAPMSALTIERPEVHAARTMSSSSSSRSGSSSTITSGGPRREMARGGNGRARDVARSQRGGARCLGMPREYGGSSSDFPARDDPQRTTRTARLQRLCGRAARRDCRALRPPLRLRGAEGALAAEDGVRRAMSVQSR